MNLYCVDDDTKEFFEKISRQKDFDIIKNKLYIERFYHKYTGINCFVFINKNIDYVVKLSDCHDPIPRKNSKFYEHYAKILYRTKNKKIILQEKVSLNTTKNKNQLIEKLYKKLKLSTFNAEEHFDLHSSNMGIRDNKLLIIDLRNYSSNIYFHNKATWYGKKIINKGAILV